MAEAWPNLSVTIADLPAITPVAQRYADEAGFATRINVCPTNVVSDPLSGSYDIAVMRGLFPVLTGGADAQRAGQRVSCAEAGKPTLRRWLDTRRLPHLAPLSYATYNLLFVNDYADGLIHTEAEHRTWLEEAGFEYVLRAALSTQLTRPISSWHESLPPNRVTEPPARAESAIGTKRTSASALHMSAFGGKADMRFVHCKCPLIGPKADIAPTKELALGCVPFITRRLVAKC